MPSSVCSVRELGDDPRYEYRPQRIVEFVRRASMIVRARAVRPDSVRLEWQQGGVWRRTGYPGVRFEVLERLAGDSVPDSLTLGGRIVDRDDFNSNSIPYRMVRSAGQRGDCYAQAYRLGAEYLLILNYRSGILTPYWIPLAPLNEQLRGPDDLWLAWVRLQLAVGPADTSGV